MSRPVKTPEREPVPANHALSVGVFVRTRRRQLGLRQHDLAAAVGVQFLWISKLENGHDGLDFSRVLRTLDALNIDLGLIARPEAPTWVECFVKQRIPRAPANVPDGKAIRGPTRPRQDWPLRALYGEKRVIGISAPRKPRGKLRPVYD